METASLLDGKLRSIGGDNYKLKVLAIVGSPRVTGNTSYLTDQALQAVAEEGIDTEKIILSEYEVKPCLGHESCASYKSCTQKDDMGWILDKFRTADGVILSTPVYYYNVSAQMKAFIDRNYWLYKRAHKYQSRAVGFIVVAAQIGIEDTLHTLRQFTEDFDVCDEGTFVASGYASEIGDAAKNLSFVREARQLGKHMAQFLKGQNTK